MAFLVAVFMRVYILSIDVGHSVIGESKVVGCGWVHAFHLLLSFDGNVRGLGRSGNYILLNNV